MSQPIDPTRSAAVVGLTLREVWPRVEADLLAASPKARLRFAVGLCQPRRPLLEAFESALRAHWPVDAPCVHLAALSHLEALAADDADVWPSPPPLDWDASAEWHLVQAEMAGELLPEPLADLAHAVKAWELVDRALAVAQRLAADVPPLRDVAQAAVVAGVDWRVLKLREPEPAALSAELSELIRLTELVHRRLG